MSSPTVTVTDPKVQIRDAVAFSRDARHHSDCCCFMYRDSAGEGFCSDRQALWNRAIDKLIDQCLAAGRG